MSEHQDRIDALMSTFSDEDLAELGITREELTPENLAALGEKVQGEAFAQWMDQEENLEEMIEISTQAIARWPDSRPDAYADIYGAAVEDLVSQDITLDEQSSHLFQLLTFAVFKLAEARLEIAKLSDSNHRRGGP